MPRPFPYLFRFFGSLIGLVCLVGLLEVIIPNFFTYFNYGFLLIAFYVLFLVTCAHVLALVFYIFKYLLFPPPPAE